MKYNILLFVLLFWNIHLIVAQPLTLNWQSCYGGQYNQEVSDIVYTNDGYILAGSSRTKILIVKYNLAGEVVWERQYAGTDSYDGAFRIFNADPGNYFIVATSNSSDGDVTYDPYPDANNCWIVKIDSEGNKIWDRIFGGTCNDKGRTGAFASDSSVVFFGSTCSSDGDITINNGDWDGWLIKVDNEGNKVWDFSMGKSSFDFASAIIETSDKGFLSATYSYYGEGGNINCENLDPTMEFVQAVLFKLDENANLQWQQCYGGSNHDVIEDIVETGDGYLLACNTFSNDGDVEGSGFHFGHDFNGNITGDFWLVKIDFNGNIIWQKCFGGTFDDSPRKVFLSEDGGFIVFGNTWSNDGDVNGLHNDAGWYNDIWVIKVSGTGQLQWQQCIGGAGHEHLVNAVSKVGTNKYVIATTIYGMNTGQVTCQTNYDDFEIWLIEVTDTTVGTFENITNTPLLQVFPNPATTWLSVEIPGFLNDKQTLLQIIDINGNTVLTQKPVSTTTHLDIRQLPAGIYVLKMINNEAFVTKRFVIR
jgi:hypothetical protein